MIFLLQRLFGKGIRKEAEKLAMLKEAHVMYRKQIDLGASFDKLKQSLKNEKL